MSTDYGGMKWKRRAGEKGEEGQNTIIWGQGKTRQGEQDMEVEYCTSPKKFHRHNSGGC